MSPEISYIWSIILKKGSKPIMYLKLPINDLFGDLGDLLKVKNAF